MNKKALITGVSGQDGSYLAELLLDKGYEVHALIRRSSNDPTVRLNDLFTDRKINFHYGNLRDLGRVREVIQQVVPDEIYNLAAQSHVGVSFDCPDETWDVNYYGVGRIVNESIKANPEVKIYQASTSEMFGNSSAPQNEKTPFNPQSPYAEAKELAYKDFILAKRERDGFFLTSGILFNHESPRRGLQFVTRKITHSFAKIHYGLQDYIELGNLNAVRDWGYAKDYVEAMYKIMQHNVPDDFVIASGKSYSVRDFVENTAACLDIEIEWEGQKEQEVGRDKKTGNVLIKVNPEFYRPKEVNELQGDISKAGDVLGWKPSTSFEELVRLMIESDLNLVARDLK